jgi:hypothetical protein
MLFLTRAETTALAQNLEAEVIGVEGDEIVADVPLARQEARELLAAIERMLGDTTDAKAVIEWRAEGF